MFREPIGQFVTETEARLFVPRNGGLNDYVTDLLGHAGVSADGTFVTASGETGRLRITAIRGEDVGRRVEDCVERGEAAYGLTGDDLFDAYRHETPNTRLDVLNTYDWFDPDAQFYRPALCLLSRDGRLPEDGPVSIAVNRKYHRISEAYLSRRLGPEAVDYTVVPYAGDTENTVAEGTHAACVEIVYRGERSAESALSRAGLRIVDIVRFSDIALIGPVMTNPWAEEYGRIVSVAERPAGSYTAGLLADDNRICKKVGEESAEYVRAFIVGEGMPEEFNGVVYALMVAAARRGIAWRDIEADLRSRWKGPATGRGFCATEREGMTA